MRRRGRIIHEAAALVGLLGAGCTVSWDSRPPGFWDTASPGAPLLVVENPEDGAVYTTVEPIPVAGRVEDDGDPTAVLVQVASNVDGPDLLLLHPAADGSFSGELALSAASHRILVAATDPDGLQASVEVDIEVQADEPPSAPVVEIEPAHPLPGEALQAVLLTPSVDPEGAPITYAWTWSRDGAVQPGLESDTVPAGTTGPLETWTVEVVASDGALSSDPGVAEVTIQAGEVPVVTVGIQPADPTVEDTLTCAWSIDDPLGGSPVPTATWTVNGMEAGDASSPLAGAFVRGDEVACTVRATNAAGEGEGTASVVVVNAPPAPPTGVDITPGDVPYGQPLSCTATPGDDPDGDPVSLAWAWRVDGVLEPGATDPTFDTSGLAPGSSVACVAASTDGLDTSPGTASTPVTVLDRLGGEVPGGGTLAGDTPGDLLGNRVAPGPDRDGDGRSELLVGGNGHADHAGEVLLLPSGGRAAWSSGLSPSDALLAWVGPTSWDQLGGGALGATPDIDGDGQEDLLLAAPVAAGAGQVYLLHSGDPWTGGDPTGDAALVLTGENATDDYGQAAAVGDLDGDGLPELAAGAPEYDGGGTDAGLLAIHAGTTLATLSGLQGLDTADHRFTGIDAGERAGTAVLVAGDLDGDGYDDLAVGAPVGGDNDAGRVYLLSGASIATLASIGNLEAAATWRIDGHDPGDELGTALATLGDVDGDGLGEFAVGVPDGDTLAPDGGSVLVFGGDALALIMAPADAAATWGADDPGGSLGASLAAGDLDDDGLLELSAGDPTWTDGVDADLGRAWLVPGGTLGSGGIASVAQAWSTGAHAGDRVGWSTALFPLDEDRFGDWVIGVRGADGGGTDAGGVLVAWGP